MLIMERICCDAKQYLLIYTKGQKVTRSRLKFAYKEIANIIDDACDLCEEKIKKSNTKCENPYKKIGHDDYQKKLIPVSRKLRKRYSILKDCQIICRYCLCSAKKQQKNLNNYRDIIYDSKRKVANYFKDQGFIDEKIISKALKQLIKYNPVIEICKTDIYKLMKTNTDNAKIKEITYPSTSQISNLSLLQQTQLSPLSCSLSSLSPLYESDNENDLNQEINFQKSLSPLPSTSSAFLPSPSPSPEPDNRHKIYQKIRQNNRKRKIKNKELNNSLFGSDSEKDSDKDSDDTELKKIKNIPNPDFVPVFETIKEDFEDSEDVAVLKNYNFNFESSNDSAVSIKKIIDSDDNSNKMESLNVRIEQTAPDELDVKLFPGYALPADSINNQFLQDRNFSEVNQDILPANTVKNQFLQDRNFSEVNQDILPANTVKNRFLQDRNFSEVNQHTLPANTIKHQFLQDRNFSEVNQHPSQINQNNEIAQNPVNYHNYQQELPNSFVNNANPFPTSSYAAQIYPNNFVQQIPLVIPINQNYSYSGLTQNLNTSPQYSHQSIPLLSQAQVQNYYSLAQSTNNQFRSAKQLWGNMEDNSLNLPLKEEKFKDIKKRFLSIEENIYPIPEEKVKVKNSANLTKTEIGNLKKFLREQVFFKMKTLDGKHYPRNFTLNNLDTVNFQINTIVLGARLDHYIYLFCTSRSKSTPKSAMDSLIKEMNRNKYCDEEYEANINDLKSLYVYYEHICKHLTSKKFKLHEYATFLNQIISYFDVSESLKQHLIRFQNILSPIYSPDSSAVLPNENNVIQNVIKEEKDDEDIEIIEIITKTIDSKQSLIKK